MMAEYQKKARERLKEMEENPESIKKYMEYKDKVNEIEASRKMMREGLAGEKDIFSRVSPVMKKQATEHFNEGLKRYKKSDEKIRTREAYDEAGYKKGGGVKKKKYASGGKVTRGDGVCKKGHTKGKMV